MTSKVRSSVIFVLPLASSAALGGNTQVVINKAARLFKQPNGYYDFDKLLRLGAIAAAVLALLWLIALLTLWTRNRKGNKSGLPTLATISLTMLLAITIGTVCGAASYRQFTRIIQAENKAAARHRAELKEAKRKDLLQKEREEARLERQKEYKRREAAQSIERNRYGILQVSEPFFKDKKGILGGGRWTDIFHAAFTPDGNQILIVGGGRVEDNNDRMCTWRPGPDCLAKLIDAKTGAVIGNLDRDFHDYGLMDASISPDGTKAVTASQGGYLHLWDLSKCKDAQPNSGKPAMTIPLIREIASLTSGTTARCVFTPNSAMIIGGGSNPSGKENRSVTVWDASTGAKLREFDGFTSGINALDCSPDGQRVAIGSNGVTIIDIATSTTIMHLPAGEGLTLTVAYSPDGKLLAAGGRDTHVRVWDASKGQLLNTIPAHNGQVYTLAWLQDCQNFVTGGFDGKVCAWNATDTGSPLRRTFGWASTQDGEPLRQDCVRSVAIAPDGNSVYAFAMNGRHYQWNLGKLAKAAQIP